MVLGSLREPQHCHTYDDQHSNVLYSLVMRFSKFGLLKSLPTYGVFKL